MPRNNLTCTDSNRSQRRGRLIVFEGLDGVGKTTQARLLAAALMARGHEVVLTREPSDGPEGVRIRVLAARDRPGRDPAEELALFQADRRRHVAEVLAPALARGAVVILDRYYFSTMAYQGALGLDPEAIRRDNETFAPHPDLVILLTLPWDRLQARLQERQGGRDAFEQEGYLHKVAAVYETLSGPHLIRVATDRPVAEVHRDLMEAVEAVLNRG